MINPEIQKKLDQLQTIFPAYAPAKTRMSGQVSLDLKKLVLELLAANVSPPMIAKKTNIAVCTIYKWRKDMSANTRPIKKTPASNVLKPQQLKFKPSIANTGSVDSGTLAKIRFQSGVLLEVPLSALDIDFLARLKSLE